MKHIVLKFMAKSGPLELAWHHLNSDFQELLNLARYLVLFAEGALGDSWRFGILTSYTLIQNAKS